MSFFDKVREKLNLKKDDNPWEVETKPKVSEDEIVEAIEHMKAPKRGYPWWKLEAATVMLWGLGHFALLYVMIGSPISGGILVYVLVNMYIFTRFLLILGKVNRK